MIRLIAIGYGAALLGAAVLWAAADAPWWLGLLAFWLGGAVLTLVFAWIRTFRAPPKKSAVPRRNGGPAWGTAGLARDTRGDA